jgi:drug/metabolite transporter (DMT)-like permease
VVKKHNRHILTINTKQQLRIPIFAPTVQKASKPYYLDAVVVPEKIKPGKKVNLNFDTPNELQTSLFDDDDDVETLALFQQNEEQNLTSSKSSNILNPRNIARLMIIACAALYGTNFTFVKILDESIPPEIGPALRFGLAFLATAPIILLSSKQKKGVDDYESKSIDQIDNLDNAVGSTTVIDNVVKSPTTNQLFSFYESLPTNIAVIIAGFEAGSLNSMGYLAQAVSLETTQASVSAFLCSLLVVVVPILDFIAGKSILPRQVTGALLALAGVILLELGSNGESISAITLTPGEILSLVQPVAFGLAIWRVEDSTRRFPNEGSLFAASSLFALFLSTTSYAIYSLGGINGLPDLSQFMTWFSNPLIIGSLFWTGIITTAFPIYLETQALKAISAAEYTILLTMEPLFGAAVASLILGETLGMNQVFGAAMILSGCLFSNVGLDFLKKQEIK